MMSGHGKKFIITRTKKRHLTKLLYHLVLVLQHVQQRFRLPFVSPNNLLVSTINGTGAAIDTIYVLIFLVFAPKKGEKKISALLLLVFAIFAAVALVSILAFHGENRKLLCGIAATIFSIIMYGSPLSIIMMEKSLFWMACGIRGLIFTKGVLTFIRSG